MSRLEAVVEITVAHSFMEMIGNWMETEMRTHSNPDTFLLVEARLVL